ncbi:MAG: hypothetical protein RSC11_05235 [Mucinivorans sp.]
MTIDQIIANELLGARSVAIPFVGTLGVELSSAHFTRGVGSAIVPPSMQLVLSEEFDQSRSIINILSAYCDDQLPDEATILYNEWIETSMQSGDGVLVIDGVCRVSMVDFGIEVDGHFSALLSPAGGVPLPLLRAVRVGRVGGRVLGPSPVLVTLSILAIVGAALYIIYYFFLRF